MSEAVTYEPGIYPDMDWETYASIDARNGSVLAVGWKGTMLHLHHAKYHGDDEDTQAMATGRARHAALFEPDHFRNNYHVLEHTDGRTKKGKEERARVRAEGKEIIKPSEVDECVAAAEAALKYDRIRNLVNGGNSEVSVVSADWGLRTKGRIDRLRDDVIVSWKTTSTLEPRIFWKTFHRLGYHLKEGFHRRLVRNITGETRPVWMVVQEQKAPYDCVSFRVHDEILDWGEQLSMVTLQRVAWCLKHNHWPGYGDAEDYPCEFPDYGMPEEQVQFDG